MDLVLTGNSSLAASDGEDKGTPEKDLTGQQTCLVLPHTPSKASPIVDWQARTARTRGSRRRRWQATQSPGSRVPFEDLPIVDWQARTARTRGSRRRSWGCGRRTCSCCVSSGCPRWVQGLDSTRSAQLGNVRWQILGFTGSCGQRRRSAGQRRHLQWGRVSVDVLLSPWCCSRWLCQALLTAVRGAC
jgi:hypothetical protein